MENIKESCWVYFVYFYEKNLVKIGRSRNVDSRVRCHINNSSFKASFLASKRFRTRGNARQGEVDCFWRFQDTRLLNEIYEVSPKMIKFIEKNCKIEDQELFQLLKNQHEAMNSEAS